MANKEQLQQYKQEILLMFQMLLDRGTRFLTNKQDRH